MRRAAWFRVSSRCRRSVFKMTRRWRHILLFAWLMGVVAPALAQVPGGAPPTETGLPDPSVLITIPALPQEPVPVDAVPSSEIVPVAALEKDVFKEALAHAYDTNPTLMAQREALKAVDENMAQAVSGFRPDLSVGYSRGRARNRTAGDWNMRNPDGKELVAVQPVFNGGESWASYKSAKERVKAGRAQLLDVEQQVLFSAVDAYSNVVEKQSVLKLSQNNVDVLARQRDAVQARFDAGTLTRTDVAQAEARLSQAQADERQALGDMAAAQAGFKRMIGFESPSDELLMPPVPPGLPQSLQETVELAKTANPSLEAARFLEKAAASDVNVRASALLPDVDITGAMSRSNETSTLGSRFDQDSLTLNVNIPLYQSGAEWSRIRQAKNIAKQAEYTTMDTHNSVVEMATRAWEDYNTAKAVIISTEEAIKAAEIALEGVKQENEFGVRTVLDVLDAEQELFSIRVNYVRAQRHEKLQAYRLLAAAGKLTPEILALHVNAYDSKEHYDTVKYQLLGF